MPPGPPRREAACRFRPDTNRRDLVRLAVLLCGERTGAKYRPPVKAAG